VIFWVKQRSMLISHISLKVDTYMLSFGNANVGDLYVNRRVSENLVLYVNKGFIHKLGGLS